MRLRERIAERVAGWARRRQGDEQLPLELQSRRLYILPTRFGLGIGALLLIMMLAGLNYANSLALLLTFTVGSVVLASMHECHRTLRGLIVAEATVGECFAGGTGWLELQLQNSAAAPRRSLRLRSAGGAAVGLDLPSAADVSAKLAVAAQQRGRQALPRLELASTAPFGLFRAWTWLHLGSSFIVYPAPLGRRTLPERSGGRSGLGSPQGAGEHEWVALRRFQTGDSPQRVAWKLVARGAPPMVAQYAGDPGDRHVLRYNELPHLSTEERLSQLALWVLECERRGESYSLQLPHLSLPLGCGARQRRAALEALALFVAA
ncbi:MAG TPA: DUF58 domain-containing protein [Steroidobacteraceae bacterium]